MNGKKSVIVRRPPGRLSEQLESENNSIKVLKGVYTEIEKVGVKMMGLLFSTPLLDLVGKDLFRVGGRQDRRAIQKSDRMSGTVGGEGDRRMHVEKFPAFPSCVRRDFRSIPGLDAWDWNN